MRPMLRGESQRAYVERCLRVDGHVSAYGAMYELVDDLGRKRSITRLAAIIEPLRKAGWNIATKGGHGDLATYVLLVSTPTWRCTSCGAEAQQEPKALLGGMSEAYCLPCRKSRLFRLSTAAPLPGGSGATVGSQPVADSRATRAAPAGRSTAI